MSVPENIRSVKRPANTVVVDTGHESRKRYIVRCRKSVKYVPGGNPQPVNGKTIGYIIDNRFVPVESERKALPEYLVYGTPCMIRQVSEDILEDLSEVYGSRKARAILVLAAFRVMRPRAPFSQAAFVCENSFLRQYYPEISLSGDTQARLLREIGTDDAQWEAFSRRRILRGISGHPFRIAVAVKRNLFSPDDSSPDLVGDLSVSYAYDPVLREPLCACVQPGETYNTDSLRRLLPDENAFPPDFIPDGSGSKSGTRGLVPVARQDERVDRFRLTEFDGVLPLPDSPVLYRKVNTPGGGCLYAFRDTDSAYTEQEVFLQNTKRTGCGDSEAFRKKTERFGLSVWESDSDPDPLTVYRAACERDELNRFFQEYRDNDFPDAASLFGKERIHFLCTLIACRIAFIAEKAGLFPEMIFTELIEELNSILRRAETPEGSEPAAEDTYWNTLSPQEFELLEALGLCRPKKKTVSSRKSRKPVSKEDTKEPPEET